MKNNKNIIILTIALFALILLVYLLKQSTNLNNSSGTEVNPINNKISGSINSESGVDINEPGNITNSTGFIRNASGNYVNASGVIFNASGNVIAPTGIILNDSGNERTFKDILISLKKENEVKKYISNNKNLNEELDILKSFNSSNPDKSYYFYLSIKDDNISICDKITNTEGKEMCIKLYNSYKSDITNFKKIYNDNFDSESNEADEIVILIKSINNKSCSDNIEVINYLTCKTVLNDKFDYYNYLVKYTILEESNKFTIENNYIEIIKYWKLNDDFMIFVKQNLISKK